MSMEAARGYDLEERLIRSAACVVSGPHAELHGRAPEVIAVSVAAQVLQVLQDDNPE